MAKKTDDLEWLNETGGVYKKADREALLGTVQGIATDLIDNIIQHAIEYKLVQSGTLTSEEGYQTKVKTENGMTIMEVYMINYGLFQDRGVKGFLKQDNAPDSPYSFKSAKFSKEGIDNLKKIISEGRQKISSKVAAKYTKIGFETKAKPETTDPLEREAKNMAYLITAYGIKTKPFFKEAFEETTGQALDYAIVEAAKKQWIAKLQYLNKQS